MKIVIPPNTLSEWYELVKETQAHTGMHLDEHIESYLILTLDNFVKDEALIDLPIAVEYLRTLNLSKESASQKLRKVGDRCLILSGLFPNHAEKSNVSLSYFIDIGRQAYLTLADRTNFKIDLKLFYNLGFRFIDLKELLNAMRLVARQTTKH